MGVPRLYIRSAIVFVFAITAAASSHAQTDDFLDELFSNSKTQASLNDWKAFVELMPRLYTHHESGRVDDQLIVWSEFEANFRISDKLTAYARPRVYADVGSEHFERWQIPDGYLTYSTDAWDIRGGFMVENWGVADTLSPLDILNPRDFATELLDPLKIGLAGVRLRRLFEGGERVGEPTLSLYWMPAFRPARYAPPAQRLYPGTPTLAFDQRSEAEPHGPEGTFWGIRYQSTVRSDFLNTDVQFIATDGPDRTPPIRLFDNGRLSPAHQRVRTVGVGFRTVPNAAVFGHFLSTLTLKGEAVRRAFRRNSASSIAASDAYWTYVLGMNKEWPNLLRDKDELAVTVEYLWDTDAASGQRLFQHDVILRLLWQVNNFNRTAVQLRGVLDPDDDETILEASFSTLLRAVSQDLTLELRYQYFGNHDDTTFLGQLPNQSLISLSLRWVFAQ